MVNRGVATARSFLDRFEAAIAGRDLAALNEMYTDDVVLFGTSRANFGPEESGEYIRRVVDASTVRWHLGRWAVLHETPTQLLVAADGQVESDDGTGPERSPFRLTLWLIRKDEDWKIGHFHGSVPEV